MILKRYKLKQMLLICGVLILYQALLVWFIEYHNSTCDSTATRTKMSFSSDSRQRSINSANYIATIKGVLNVDGQENHYQSGKFPDLSKTVAIMNGKYTKLKPISSSKVPRGAKSVDIENDYYPYVDFKFVAPEISPKVNFMRKYFMLVLVNTGAKGNVYRKHREAIRQTWGNHSNCEQIKALTNETLKSLNWLLVFVVGKAGLGTNDDELNMAEARKHNDMLIGNITDNYMNNIV